MRRLNVLDRRSPLQRCLLGVSIAIAVSVPASASHATSLGKERFRTSLQPSISLSSTPSLIQLIDLCALQFGVDIEYNASDSPLTAKLTLRSAGEYTPQELWELTHRMLETKGRTTVLAPGVRRLYRVVQLTEAAAATEPLAAIPDPPPGYVVLRYPVQHAAPEAVLAALNEPRPPVWEAAVSADRSGVVVGALTRRHDAVRRLVERLDAEAASVRITLIDVQHADPQAVLAAVNAAKERLPGKLPGTISQGPRPAELLLTAPEAAIPRWRSLVAQFDVPQSAETRTYPLPNFGAEDIETLLEQIARRPGPTGSGDAWKLVRNPLVGTLLVTATPAEHTKVAELLAQIASIPADQRRATRTFTVRNRNAEDLRESLSRLLGVSIGGAAVDPVATPPAEGQPVRVAGTTPAAGPQAAEPELLLAVDPELNAIIAVGPPHLLDAASDLIARMMTAKTTATMVKPMSHSISPPPGCLAYRNRHRAASEIDDQDRQICSPDDVQSLLPDFSPIVTIGLSHGGCTPPLDHSPGRTRLSLCRRLRGDTGCTRRTARLTPLTTSLFAAQCWA